MRIALSTLAMVGAGASLFYLMTRSRSREAAPPVQPVRDAGAEAMRDPPHRWDPADQRSDESFPASDPPATY